MYQVLSFQIDINTFAIYGKDTLKFRHLLKFAYWSNETINPYSKRIPKHKGSWIISNVNIKAQIDLLNNGLAKISSLRNELIN